MTDYEREAEIRKWFDDRSNAAAIYRNMDSHLDEARANCAEAGAKVSELAIKLNEARTEIARLRALIGERQQPGS